jgi:hypothetical protein
MESRESLKNVSLGTSKINYLDPRYAAPHTRCTLRHRALTPCPRLRSITVAWCKRHDVPIEKIFTKVLLEKFGVRVLCCVLCPAQCGVRLSVRRFARCACASQWAMECVPSFDF